jgi:hypothetical protein
MSLWEERAARNEAVFREVNEQIEALEEQFSVTDEDPVFICECSDENCTERISLPLDAYESLRGNPRHFVILPGHETEIEEVVERHATYFVVEKQGRAGHIADDTDPRAS